MEQSSLAQFSETNLSGTGQSGGHKGHGRGNRKSVALRGRGPEFPFGGVTPPVVQTVDRRCKRGIEWWMSERLLLALRNDPEDTDVAMVMGA